MTFRIEEGEPLPWALRRVVASQIDRCLEAVGSEPLEGSAHEVRRALKRIRAVLKLVRAAFPGDVWKAEDVVYRDLGRDLDEVRDAAVLVSLVARLQREASDPLQEGLSELAKRLADRRRRVDEAFAESGALLRVAGRLEEARGRPSLWRLEDQGFGLIRPGLRRSYGRARAVGLRVRRGDARAEVFHEWRKRTKDVRHHVELLEGLWPPVLAATAEELHRLSDLLGEANDLGVLRDALGREPSLELAPPLAEAIDRTAEALQVRLWGEALPAGRRIYAEPPAAWVGRLSEYWEASRAT